MLAAALDYAARGWPVLPLHTFADGRCTCSDGDACKTPAKHPRTQHGFLDATTDATKITAWWRKWPDANVGICTGSASGVVGLDVDPRHGGDENLRQLQATHGPLPPTLTAATGGGGWHHVFRTPRGVVIRGTTLAPGVELKADGGFIVAPPSTHASGRRYAWANAAEPVEIPPWLLALNRRDHERTQVQPTPTDPITTNRNVTLTRIAGQLRRQGFDADEIAAELLGFNAAGCVPPLAEAEVRKIAGSIGRRQPGGLSTALLALHRQVEDAILHGAWSGRAGATDRAVLEAHLRIARACNRMLHHASVRDVAERAGVNKETASTSHRRLVTAGWLRRVGTPTTGHAHEWRLQVPAGDETARTNRTLWSPPSFQEGSVRVTRVAQSADAFRRWKNALPLLRAVAAEPGSTSRMLAERLRLHVATVRRNLTRAAEHGFVVVDRGCWRLGDVGRAALDRAARARGTAGKGMRQKITHAADRALHRIMRDLKAQGIAATLREARWLLLPKQEAIDLMRWGRGRPVRFVDATGELDGERLRRFIEPLGFRLSTEVWCAACTATVPLGGCCPRTGRAHGEVPLSS